MSIAALRTPSHLKEFTMTDDTDVEFDNLSPRLQHALNKVSKMDDPIEVFFILENDRIKPFILREEIEE